MRVGVAEARRRFREILDRVHGGETVEILRRDAVVAVVGPPPPTPAELPLDVELSAWRDEWSVAGWPDDESFGDLRDRTTGRDAPW